MARLEILEIPGIAALLEVLRDRFLNGLRLVRRYQNALALFILRKFLIPSMLFITYFLAFGVMAIFLRIFGRKYLAAAPKISPGSNWVEARGYESDRLQLMQQS